LKHNFQLAQVKGEGEDWNDSEKNEKAFKGGWFHTGDMARRGKWGMLYFADRKEDVVKAGGYSSYHGVRSTLPSTMRPETSRSGMRCRTA
jgi:acyl-CoA synthetase (AMP-forming)/AMP-acid ligase II